MTTINELQTAIERLRADLMASDMALRCLAASQPPELQRLTLRAMADLIAKQEAFVEQQPIATEQHLMRLLAASMQRAHDGMQAAQRMRPHQVLPDLPTIKPGD